MFIPIILIILTALMVFNSNIHIPCTPFIRNELQASSFIIQFAFILNPLISIFANFAFGFLSEFYNKKSLLIITLICFLSGSLCCFYSPTIGIFLLGRLFQAIGDGGIVVLGIAILSIISKEQFAYYLGVSSATFAIAWGTGPIFGTLIFNLIGWRWNFFVLFFLVLLITILLIHYLPHNSLRATKDKPFNISSMWHSTVKLLNNPNFSASNWAAAIAIGTFGAFEINSPFIFIDSYNFTPSKFSFFNALIITINCIASIAYIKIVRHFGVKGAFITGFITYIGYVFGAILFLSRLLLPSPYLILLFIGFLASSLPFLTSTTTIYALKESEDNPSLALTILSCSRNIASSSITLIVSAFYTGEIYPFFTASFAFSIIALRFLFIILSVK